MGSIQIVAVTLENYELLVDLENGKQNLQSLKGGQFSLFRDSLKKVPSFRLNNKAECAALM